MKWVVADLTLDALEFARILCIHHSEPHTDAGVVSVGSISPLYYKDELLPQRRDTGMIVEIKSLSDPEEP